MFNKYSNFVSESDGCEMKKIKKFDNEFNVKKKRVIF
jgi:hypothetical protein